MKEVTMNVIMSQIGRYPSKKVKTLSDKYIELFATKPLVHTNKFFSYIENKVNIVRSWYEKNGMEDILTYKLIAKKNPILSPEVFKEIANLNELNPTIQVEIAHELSESEILNLLNNFGSKLSSLVIQNFIIALSSNNQKVMLIKYKDNILESGFDTLVSFIAVLSPSIQKSFLSMIKEYIRSQESIEICALLTFLDSENIRFFLKEFSDCVSELDFKDIIDAIKLLSLKDCFVVLNNIGDKLNEIPADILSYQLSLMGVESHQLYNFWSSNKNKLVELSDTGFLMLFHKLDTNDKMDAITTFKEQISKYDASTILDILEYDSDLVIEEVFRQYQDVISKLSGEEFVYFVNTSIDSDEVKSRIFLQYKDYLCSLDDNNFIYFVKIYAELNIFYKSDKEGEKNKYIENFFDCFKDRLRSISLDNIPKLFEESGTIFPLYYVSILEDNIIELINQKKIKHLFKKIAFPVRMEILKRFKEYFKVLNANELWEFLNTLDYSEIEIIKELLLSCDIDNFDFVNINNLTRTLLNIEAFGYLEKNASRRLYDKSGSLSDLNLINKCKELVRKVILEDYNDVLISYDCLTILTLFRLLLERNVITDQDKDYLSFKEFYTSKIFKRLTIEDNKNCELIKDILFYRLIKGSIRPSMLINIKTLKGLIFLNKVSISEEESDNINIYRSNEIEAITNLLTEEQVINLNYKLFKKMCDLVQNTIMVYIYGTNVRNLAIRLYLTLGYYNAKKIIDLGYNYTVYEYLFSNIDLKKITLDHNGEPIINKKLNDFLFGSSLKDKNTNMNRLLANEIPVFEKRFAEVYNNWDLIYNRLNGNVTVARILKFFEDNVVLLSPDQYRLNEVISEFGGDEKVIKTATNLYSCMKLREYSTIPKVKGDYNADYTYEMLDLDDPLGLVVGYITRCCFLINGLSNSSLVYSATSNKSRIFVVRKNGELIAQSWVWRCGNLVCFDNVEARGTYDSKILLEVYKKAALEILDVSKLAEEPKEQIKLVTVGSSWRSMYMPDKRVPFADTITPKNFDERLYTDAHEQFILAETEDRNLYYGDVKAKYKDERKAFVRYTNLKGCKSEEKDIICKKIMAIEYVKNETLCTLDLSQYIFLSLNEDWYILIDYDGNIIYNILDKDERAKEELFRELSKLEIILREMNIKVDTRKIKSQVLALTKGDK